MNCKKVEKNLIFYIDDDLDESKIALFKNHIENCSKCQLLFEQFHASYTVINHDKITESNPFFFTRLMSAMKKEKEPRLLHNYFAKKQHVLKLGIYIFLGVFAIAAGHFIANDRTMVEQESIQNKHELTDQQLFADSYHLNLNVDDAYIIKANEIEE